MKGLRWKVACINWGHADAPKAAAYALRGDELVANRYFDEWADAVAWAFERAARTTTFGGLRGH